MLDIRLIRKGRQEVEAKLKTKDPQIDLSIVCELDEKVRQHKTTVEALKAKRNEISQEIGELKRQGKDASLKMAEASRSAEQIHALDHETKELEMRLQEALSLLPNLPLDEIPISDDPKDNVTIYEFGQKPVFSFPFKNHLELNEQLHLFDFKRGAKISGTGWPVYSNLGARLEWALWQYMVDIHIKNGFIQWIPPLLVRKETMFASGQLPKFEKQLFKIHDEDYFLYLVPTAEVPLNGLYMDEVLEEEQFPLQYIAYTPCFRREAGAAGSQERGLIRMHQFNKVEMFAFCLPEQSDGVFAKMLKSAEEILEGLGLHYRHSLLVTGDMSFAAAKTVDVEVWLPGQGRYYEVSSVSYCSDYQGRRSNTRVRRGKDRLEPVHTLNGSGVATSRLMVALLENKQRADGSVEVPTVLKRYLGESFSLTPSIPSGSGAVSSDERKRF